MKVDVNKKKCIGCGLCIALVPEVFDFDEDGKAYVKIKDVKKDLKEKVKEAYESCPTGAIEIEE